MSSATLNEFVGIKYADLRGGAPKLMWQPPDSSVWICSLIAQSPKPGEVHCLIGRITPSMDARAQYSVAALDLTHATLTEIAILAAPAY
jgi:hypothetical protein